MRIINGRISTSVLINFVRSNLQHSGTIELSEMTDVISELFEMSGQNRTEGDKHSPQPRPANDIKTHHQSDYYVSWLV